MRQCNIYSKYQRKYILKYRKTFVEKFSSVNFKASNLRKKNRKLKTVYENLRLRPHAKNHRFVFVLLVSRKKKK